MLHLKLMNVFSVLVCLSIFLFVYLRWEKRNISKVTLANLRLVANSAHSNFVKMKKKVLNNEMNIRNKQNEFFLNFCFLEKNNEFLLFTFFVCYFTLTTEKTHMVSFEICLLYTTYLYTITFYKLSIN